MGGVDFVIFAHDMLTAEDREQVLEAITALATCDYIPVPTMACL